MRQSRHDPKEKRLDEIPTLRYSPLQFSSSGPETTVWYCQDLNYMYYTTVYCGFVVASVVLNEGDRENRLCLLRPISTDKWRKILVNNIIYILQAQPHPRLIERLLKN